MASIIVVWVFFFFFFLFLITFWSYPMTRVAFPYEREERESRPDERPLATDIRHASVWRYVLPPPRQVELAPTSAEVLHRSISGEISSSPPVREWRGSHPPTPRVETSHPRKHQWFSFTNKPMDLLHERSHCHGHNRKLKKHTHTEKHRRCWPTSVSWRTIQFKLNFLTTSSHKAQGRSRPLSFFSPSSIKGRQSRGKPHKHSVLFFSISLLRIRSSPTEERPDLCFIVWVWWVNQCVSI